MRSDQIADTYGVPDPDPRAAAPERTRHHRDLVAALREAAGRVIHDASVGPAERAKALRAVVADLAGAAEWLDKQAEMTR